MYWPTTESASKKIIITTNPTSEALAKSIGLGYQNKALFNDEATAVFKSVFNNPASQYILVWRKLQ
jgi:hypothetical protein